VVAQGLAGQERAQFVGSETGSQPGFAIHRGLWPRGVKCGQHVAIGDFRVAAALGAKFAEPAVAESYMSDFVAKDDVEGSRAGVVPGFFEPLLDGRCGIQAACFE